MSTLSVEQMCRELLIAALKDGVFDNLDTFALSRSKELAEDYFGSLTAGDITGMSNKLHDIIRRSMFQK